MPTKLDIMDEKFIQWIKEHSKVTYYLLPLLKLNKFSFGEGNFIESYVNEEGTVICVEVHDGNLCPEVSRSKWLLEITSSDGRWQFWLRLEGTWNLDFRLFRNGLYSRFSERAKAMIRTHSGMPYRQMAEDSFLYTDYRLLALERSDVLRKKWEQELQLDEHLRESMDLMEPPGPSNFKAHKR